METITAIARFFIAIAMFAFGFQHLVHADFVTRLVPKLPPWIPWQPLWAYVAGAGLIVAALAIVFEKQARFTALLLGALILLSSLFLQLPLAALSPHNGGLWTNTGKALALSGAAFLIAGSLPKDKDRRLDRLIPLAPFFLGAFLILCGIQHFIYADFVATLVPAWIPGHLFWTYFAGLALIAGGAGMLIPVTVRWAAALSGIMIFLWVWLVHVPRALADLHNANETTAVFEAVAISSAAILVATVARRNAKDAIR